MPTISNRYIATIDACRLALQERVSTIIGIETPTAPRRVNYSFCINHVFILQCFENITTYLSPLGTYIVKKDKSSSQK